jgi:hypothetical protein
MVRKAWMGFARPCLTPAAALAIRLPIRRFEQGSTLSAVTGPTYRRRLSYPTDPRASVDCLPARILTPSGCITLPRIVVGCPLPQSPPIAAPGRTQSFAADDCLGPPSKDTRTSRRRSCQGEPVARFSVRVRLGGTAADCRPAPSGSGVAGGCVRWTDGAFTNAAVWVVRGSAAIRR